MLDVKITFVRVIIKTFEIIAHANTLVNSQKFNIFIVIRKIVIQKKRVYQNFINCAIEIVIYFRNRQIHETNFAKIDLNSFANEIKNNNVAIMNDIFFVVANSNSNENFLVKSKTRIVFKATKNKKRQFTKLKFKKLLMLFNIHAKLHLNEMTRKYVTIMNLSVLIEKNKTHVNLLNFSTNQISISIIEINSLLSNVSTKSKF